MLAQGDEGGQATVRNACLARSFQAISYESTTSLELGAIIQALMHRIPSELRS